MALVWILGLMLAFNVDAFSQAWFHAKLALVIALSAYQGWLKSYGKKLASGDPAGVRQDPADDQRDSRDCRGPDRRSGHRPSILNGSPRERLAAD